MKIPRKIGYARVSTKDQNLDMQIDALRAEGCEEIFQEKISGLKKIRPVFDECMQSLKEGDTLVVYSIDRVGRSFKGLINIIDDLYNRKIIFKSLKDPLFDLSTAQGQLLLHIQAAIKAYEVSLNKERSADGIIAAKLKGVKFGRTKVTAMHPNVRAAKQLSENTNMTKKEIALQLGCGRTVIYKYLKL